MTVSYSTSNGTATAESDYQSASGTVTFAAGETSKTISVLVNGDRAGEVNETFSVNLSLVEGNAVLADSQATGTIVDDEPRVRINGVSKNEGNNGTTSFVFTVTLSAASGAPVSVNFATADQAPGHRTTTRPNPERSTSAGDDQQDDHRQRER